MTTILIPSAEQVHQHIAHVWGMAIAQVIVQLPSSPGSVALFRIDSRPRRFLYIVGRGWGEDYWEQAAASAAHLTKMNFPTPRFIPTLTGEIIARSAWGDCVMRDWFEGEPIPRQELTSEDQLLLGRTLGKCHRILSTQPAYLTHDWSDTKRGQLIEELQAAYQQLDRPEKIERDATVLEAIAKKVSLLQELTIPYDQLRTCPAQVVHGDFHPLNVLFNERRRIAAVIDVGGWSDYRIFEVLKGAIHCQSGEELVPFDLSEINAFVSGYLVDNDLSLTEIRTGINLYWRDLLWRMGGVAGYIRSLHPDSAEPSDSYAEAVISLVELAEWLRDEGHHLEEALRTLVEA